MIQDLLPEKSRFSAKRGLNRAPPATCFRCEMGADSLRSRPASILLKEFIRFVDNAEMGDLVSFLEMRLPEVPTIAL